MIEMNNLYSETLVLRTLVIELWWLGDSLLFFVRAGRDSLTYDLPPDRYAREAAEAMTSKSFKRACMQVAVFLMGSIPPLTIV